ncbi:MAG: superoxide dismutase [Ardenticatenaceae bacterium]|nr:superoxide dismutase [Ardenticatenaceae bacterium]
MRKFRVLSIVTAFLLLTAVLFTAVPVSAAGVRPRPFPDTIPLPNGFQPEGIVIGRGLSIYAGSLANGAIYQANLRTGEGDILVEGEEGLIAVGLGYDRRTNNLFVSGGVGGDARVYDAATGELLMSYQLTAPGNTFINDVIVTWHGAYFTDSYNAVMYRLPLTRNGRLPDPQDVEAIPLTGDFEFVPGGFNANGIASTFLGRYLIIVNSTTGTLYRVDADSGEALAIDLGGETLTNGDGLVLRGRTLYVVRNALNEVAVVKLNGRLTSGEVVDTISSDAFRFPTTADLLGRSLYVVNARFDVTPTPDTEYEIVRVSR